MGTLITGFEVADNEGVYFEAKDDETAYKVFFLHFWFLKERAIEPLTRESLYSLVENTAVKHSADGQEADDRRETPNPEKVKDLNETLDRLIVDTMRVYDELSVAKDIEKAKNVKNEKGDNGLVWFMLQLVHFARYNDFYGYPIFLEVDEIHPDAVLEVKLTNDEVIKLSPYQG